MPGTFCLRSLESFVISTSPLDRKQNGCDSAVTLIDSWCFSRRKSSGSIKRWRFSISVNRFQVFSSIQQSLAAFPKDFDSILSAIRFRIDFDAQIHDSRIWRGNKLASLVRLTTVTSSESFHTSAELFRRASVPSDDVRSTIGAAPRVAPSSASSSHNIAMIST
nr:Os01g0855700 [Ipomoea batatas]